jgi:hypothetical protein
VGEIPPLACRLDALDPREQSRRASLADALTARFVEVDETADGYLARLPYDASVSRDALEWLLLERRCCPFLRLQLGFEPDSETMWIRFGGGPGVKALLQDAGLRTRRPQASCCS